MLKEEILMIKNPLESKGFNPPISIISCFARSGGTMLNRWLLTSEDVIVLSEVNPANEGYGKIQQTVKWQAKEWYGIEINKEGYIDQIIDLYRWCTQHQKYLVIREWPYIDFMPCGLNDQKPVGVCSTYEMLKSKVPVRIIAFVRDSIDVYLSLRDAHPDISDFMLHYNNYIDYLCKNHIDCVKYEDFCRSPHEVGLSICEKLLLPPVTNLNVKLERNARLTGDTLVSRGNVSSDILILNRKYISRTLRNRLNKNIFMKRANEALAYPITYESRDYVSFFENMIMSVKYLLLNIVKRIRNKVS